MKDPSKRMIRWISELAQYSPVIQHIPGSTNTADDAIIRQVHLHFLNSIYTTTLYRHTPLLPIDIELSPTPTPPHPDPNNWLSNYATDPWYLKHCLITDAEAPKTDEKASIVAVLDTASPSPASFSTPNPDRGEVCVGRVVVNHLGSLTVPSSHSTRPRCCERGL